MSANLITLDQLAEFHHQLKEGEVILDVRSADEYAELRIPESINIPHDEILEHIDELKKYSKIYIHCKMGGRAKKAFDALKDAGLNNVFCVYDAGIVAWEQKGHPLNKN